MTFNGVHVFALKMGPPLSKTQWDALAVHLSTEEQMRVLKHKQWQDRQRALLGNILVRWALQKFTGMQHIHITRNELGRPSLADNNYWNGDFNLSHAGEWIVVALTNQGHVGVDVEKIAELHEDVMVYALAEAELQVIHQRAKSDQIQLFYTYWTMKEALFKTGLFPNATPQTLDTIAANDKRKDIHTQLVYIDQEHPVSICWHGENSSSQLTILDREQFIHSVSL
ncbi:4'-phosphopantetheinyl transferase superfamily protein [Sporosarcina sp. FSL K6-1522]|uniref:4'-phosphopantetheinyl transferase family protein n=1 Tax=Sporosarcina sp. FSL K6-1522 TaxID=2921554 RepID=UPI003159B4AA